MFKPMIMTRVTFYSLFFSLITFTSYHLTCRALESDQKIILSNIIKTPTKLALCDESEIIRIAWHINKDANFKEQCLESIRDIELHKIPEKGFLFAASCALLTAGLAISAAQAVSIKETYNLNYNDENADSLYWLYGYPAVQNTIMAFFLYAGRRALKEELLRDVYYKNQLSLLKLKLLPSA